MTIVVSALLKYIIESINGYIGISFNSIFPYFSDN